VLLSEDTYLVGMDGWADAQYGDTVRTTVWLNDFEYIEDLKGYSPLGSRKELHTKLKGLGLHEAQRLRKYLEMVPESAKRVVVATHVPPYETAACHRGKISEPDFLPYFSCKATGKTIDKFSVSRPETKIDVFCGHTHGHSVYEKGNITVYTGKAQYGYPEIQIEEI